VNVSSISLSNISPVSPGAKETSKFCAIIESDVRKLISARFFPGQPYAPIWLSAAKIRIGCCCKAHLARMADTARCPSPSPTGSLRNVLG
jgi:hypothetical protein